MLFLPPSFAGMREETVGMAIRLFSTRRHSGAGRNPGREAGMVNGRRVLADGAFGLSCLWLSFPLCGNVLSKPLDSGLRRNDD